jgi:NAD(P)-dependent dehydrogenase (short-subunit alcohol dehydrogenase family)
MAERTTKYGDLAGKTVLLTGGANGIGEAMVREFGGQGAGIHFCDIDDEAGERLAAEVEGASYRHVDLREPGEIGDWVGSVSTVDVLVNNAARDPRIPLGEMSAAVWDDVIALNLRAQALTVREALSRFSRPASVINFSSVTFHLGPPEMAAYVASKGGILAMTRSLARELGPGGVRVNTISPGWTMTERQEKEFVDDQVRAMLAERQCKPELLEPVEIARVALFLASEASSAITGQEILADRGWFFS